MSAKTKGAEKTRGAGMRASFFGGPEEFRRLKDDPPLPGSLAAARDHIGKLILNGGEDSSITPEATAANKAHFLFSVELSMEHLHDYATLDDIHVKDILRFTQSIADYADDQSRLQPLNWVMVASPGEGKSHFIKCIANKLKDRVVAVLFNMASMRQKDDLGSALDRARNATIEGKIPLLFLDEFDSDERNYSLLLPLLWEGEIELGTRRLKIGRVVVVLAGSNPELLAILERAGSMKDEEVQAGPHKLVDLFSRINGGVVRIPSLREVDYSTGRDRRIDKVCVAIALLRRKFGENLKAVPAGLLCFIYHMTFRFGARSIQHLIELVSGARNGNRERLGRLVDEEGLLSLAGLGDIFGGAEGIASEGLIYHLIHTDHAAGIKETWDDACKNQHIVPVWCRAFQEFGPPTSWKAKAAGSFAQQMVLELKGELADGEFVDVTTFAGIEPLHITQLWLSPDDGEWNHGNKDMRHVFFNLSTLQELLAATILNTSPREVGRRMGNKFGRDFVRFLSQIGELEVGGGVASTGKVIEHWCRFDVSGGWGKWEYERSHSEIHVRNNFLAVRVPGSEVAKKSPFCKIMEGYIKGVLEEVERVVRPGENLTVEVRELGCGISNPKTTPCRFRFKINSKGRAKRRASDS